MTLSLLPSLTSLLYLTAFAHATSYAWQNASKPLASGSCKAIPGQPDWPSEAQWAQLQAAVKGRLLAPQPPGAVCHREISSSYNATACETVREKWGDSKFHAADPVSNMWQNYNGYSCMPSGGACTNTGYPIYVVAAQEAGDVKAAVDFARAHGVRLNVKSTGHDFLGRSVQPYSLSIWTHALKSFKWHDTSFTPKGCAIQIPGPAATVGSGSQWGEIFEQGKKRGVGFVGGAFNTVSVGGYLSNGGHGALSARYGLGADMVLEIELVTPMGEVITANECQNQDFFWAMRGGGGSTYGVALSFTIQGVHSGTTASYKNSVSGWEEVAHIHAEWPKIAALGGGGYINGYPSRGEGKVSISVNMPNTTQDRLRAVMEPIMRSIKKKRRSRSLSNTEFVDDGEYAEYHTWDDARVAMQEWRDPAVEYVSRAESDSQDAQAAQGTFPGLGQNKIIVSWLYSAADVAKPGLAAALRGAFDGDAQMLNDATMGVGTANPPFIRGGGNAVNPAFRTAVMRPASELQWSGTDLRVLAKRKADAMRFGASFKSLAPTGGTYANEADPDTPDWQHAFWGSNYERLFKIKTEKDPYGVFYCRSCVGSELFEDRNGVLCRR